MINVNTNRYVASHGTSPRGQGQWVFESADGFQIWVCGTYTEAKREAKRAYAAHVNSSYGELYVCS